MVPFYDDVYVDGRLDAKILGMLNGSFRSSLSINPATPLTQDRTLYVVDENGTLATREWADARFVNLTTPYDDPVFVNTLDWSKIINEPEFLTESEAIATYIPLTQKGIANGVVPLGPDLKIASTYLPALAITDTFVVNSQAAMLALTAERGDVAVRTDLNKSFILRVEPASTLANWQELLTPTDAVISVNGQTGVVNLTTSNIAEGTNLYWTNARGDARYPQLTGAYADPSWITQLAWSKITGAPASFPTSSNLQTVTTNGNTTTNNIAFPNAATGVEWRNGSSIRWLLRQDTFPTSDFSLYKYDDAGTAFTVLRGARATGIVDFSLSPTRAGNTIWDANNHPAGAANSQTLTGPTVYSNITTNSAGHLTAVATRSLTAADIGAAPASGSTNYIQASPAASQVAGIDITSAGASGAIFRNSSATSTGSGGPFVRMLGNGAPTGADQRFGGYIMGVYSNFSTYYTAGQIETRSSAGWTLGSSHPSYMSFFIGQTGTTALNEVMRLANNGVTISNVPALGTAATVFLTVNGGIISSRTAAQVLSDIGAGTSTKIQNGSNVFEALSPNGFRIDHQVGFPSGAGNMNILMHDPFAAAGAPNVKALVANLNFVLAGTSAANAQNVRFTISQEALLLGGIGLGQKSVSANTTMGTTDCVVYANSSGGTVTVTLQGTSVNLSTGKIFIVKRTGGNTVTVQAANSGTINGAATYTLGTDKQVVMIQYVGSDVYHVLSDSTPA